VKRLSGAQVGQLSQEIRDFLVEWVTRTGGHLGPNLGVVELTIALHRVFDSPHDVLLWDTGHQAYVHKLLTGRRSGFARLRQRDGMSGYPSQAESEHDVIENSHASAALSYADGIAKAFALRDESRCVVAVVGDGALTGGMCWEALNNLGGAEHRPVIIVLNDNGRSYAPTVGGVADHLDYLRRRGPVDPDGGRSIFTSIGLQYLGPIDGHDVAAIERALRAARDQRRPVVVHCVTRKGNGYRLAETHEADRMHAIGAAAPHTASRGAVTETWTDVFAAEMVRAGAERPDVVAVSAAMTGPVGLLPFATAYPDRAFDVGIAEQHAVTSAAGLAIGGMHPVVAVYAAFLNRAFDQALMDVALHRLGVTFVLDRAGITGDDGASHNGMWDLPLMQMLPGARIAAPRDATTLRLQLRQALDVHDRPTVVRFPKSPVGSPMPAIDQVDGVDVLSARPNASVLIISIGALAPICLTLADELADRGVAATVIDPCWVHPVNPALARWVAAHSFVATIEDGNTTNGVGSNIAQFMAANRVAVPVLNFGIPPRFQPTAQRRQLLESIGLGPASLVTRILDEVASRRVRS